MPRNNSKFSWSILAVLYLSVTIVSSDIVYPDSYEMYSYKEPRSMNDLKNQHMRQAMIDVTDTINRVQQILQKDPKLPRLTRGEIEDLFEMVTREEYKRSLAAGDFERAKHMRSLMLVLPFNTNNYSEERLEELFTQMPVTKMINNVPKTPKPQRVVLPASAENSILDMTGAHSVITKQQLPTTFKPNFPTNMKPVYKAPVTTFHPKGHIQPVQTFTNVYPKTTVQTAYPPQMPAQMMTSYQPRTTLKAVPTFHPKAGAPPFPTVYNPKVTSGPIANYHPRTTAQNAPNFHPKATIQTGATNAIPTNFISTYHPKTTTYNVVPESDVVSSLAPIASTNHKFSSRFSAQTTNFVTSHPVTGMMSITPTIRPNIKNLLATIGLQPDSNALEINNQMSELQESSSSVQTDKPKITTTTPSTTTTTSTTTPKPELTPELEELLKSFGLLTNEEPPAHVTAGQFQDEFLPVYPNSLKDESLSVSEFKPLPKSVTASDLKDKIDTSFEIKPDDFTAFKPLRIKENEPAKDGELEDLLKTYGILEDDRANKATISDSYDAADSEESGSEPVEVTEKITKMSAVPEVDVAFLSPELVEVLGNIGVKNVNKDQGTSTAATITRRLDAASTVKASHSTAGVLPASTMENDYQKLHLLLDTIKELDNLTANLTDEELARLNLKNFNLSQDTLTESTGPDPTFGFENEASAEKNEVKRQTNSSEPTRIQLDITGSTPSSSNATTSDDLDDFKSDDSTDSTTTETTERKAKKEEPAKEDDSDASESEKDSVKDTEKSPSSTTEETKNGSITDLAGSFGGNDGLDPVSEEPLPPPRKNGFYFFADWNSFLEVGEEPDQVVVRFDPKIGDQTHFVPVKIP